MEKTLIYIFSTLSSKINEFKRKQLEKTKKLKSDAIITQLEGFGLGVVTADCVPIIIYDSKNKIIGCIHAGWKGALKGIIENTVNEFKKINNYQLTLDRCHSTVGIAILNTSITIVFGFSILVLSNFIPTIYFGVFTGIAMLLAMISVLTLLPKLILVLKPFGQELSSS